jgi:hypothetical protein
MALGLPVGVNESYRREHYGFQGWGTVYVVALTLLLLGLATLTLGLVRRWGEVTPRWMPFIGGKRVPPLAAIVPAATGALALTVMWVGVFLNAEDIFVVYGLEGRSRIVLIACYAPLLLWGPLLAAVTISYAHRTLAQSVHAGQRTMTERDPLLQPAHDEGALETNLAALRRWRLKKPCSAGGHIPRTARSRGRDLRGGRSLPPTSSPSRRRIRSP